MFAATSSYLGLMTVWYVLTLLIGSFTLNVVIWGEFGKIYPGMSSDAILRIYTKTERINSLRSLFIIGAGITAVMWIFFLAMLFTMTLG